VDHVAGLPTFINLRNLGKGANDKPLTIYYPVDNDRLIGWLDFVLKNQRLKYPVARRPLAPNELTPIQGGRNPKFLHAFPAVHGPQPCLGYRILEERLRLKPEYARLPPEETEQLMRKVSPAQRRDYLETYTRALVVYTGDTAQLSAGPASPLWEADTVFHDVTFLKVEDRELPAHCSLDEAVESALQNKVKQLYGIHVSNRYLIKDVTENETRVRQRFPAVSLINPYRVVRLDESARPRAKSAQPVAQRTNEGDADENS
jgi:ribonuclease BN (tRNA processing enzyme)